MAGKFRKFMITTLCICLLAGSFTGPVYAYDKGGQRQKQKIEFTFSFSPYYSFIERMLTVNLNENGIPSLEGSVCQMFDSCRKLRDIDLSRPDFSNVSNVFRAFYRCESLRTVVNYPPLRC